MCTLLVLLTRSRRLSSDVGGKSAALHSKAPSLPPAAPQRDGDGGYKYKRFDVTVDERRRTALVAVFKRIADVATLQALCLVSKQWLRIVGETTELWLLAERAHRAPLDRLYCYDMVFECLGREAAQLSARQRATTLARLFALDTPSEAFGSMQCIDRGCVCVVAQRIVCKEKYQIICNARTHAYTQTHTHNSAESFVYVGTFRRTNVRHPFTVIDNVALVKATRFATETLQNQRMRLREVVLLARCSHPSIVGVGQSRFRIDDGSLWIELEHMAG